MQKTLELLEKTLLKRQHRFTDYEASSVTGLAIDQVKDGIEQLIKKYVCRIQVTENGDLIYDFGSSPRQWDEKPFTETLQKAAEYLWKAFTLLFKAWLTVTLVIYFVIFLILMILLVVAASSGKRGQNRGTRGGLSFNGLQLLHILMSIFRWRTITGGTRNRHDDRGYPYREYEPQPGTLNKKKKNFIAAVYDFVFGPPRVDISQLANAKEVAAFLGQNNGILVTADLEALAGLDRKQAEQSFTDYLNRYDGEVLVSDNGAVYGKFKRILRGVAPAEGKIVNYWDEYEPEYQVTGNSAGRNFLIVAMNAFNLLISYLVTQGAFTELVQLNINGPGGELLQAVASHPLLFGGVPLVFSLLFIIIPLTRWVRILRLRQHRQKNNIRKRLYKAIFASYSQPQTADSICKKVNRCGKEETLPMETITGMLKELVLDLDGETDVSEDADIQYHFPRIRLELEEAPRLRADHASDRDLGEVIFDTNQ